jgi:Sel1 repeat-containing protein
VLTNGKGFYHPLVYALEYRKAAEQGYASAQCNLGIMFGEGDGAPVNCPEAYMWFRLSAANAYSSAEGCGDKLLAKMIQAEIQKGERLFAEYSRTLAFFDALNGLRCCFISAPRSNKISQPQSWR